MANDFIAYRLRSAPTPAANTPRPPPLKKDPVRILRHSREQKLEECRKKDAASFHFDASLRFQGKFFSCVRSVRVRPLRNSSSGRAPDDPKQTAEDRRRASKVHISHTLDSRNPLRASGATTSGGHPPQWSPTTCLKVVRKHVAS